MQKHLLATSSIAGFVGLALCVIAGLTRATGSYYLANYEAMTIFNAGVAMMVFACWAKLEVLTKGHDSDA